MIQINDFPTNGNYSFWIDIKGHRLNITYKRLPFYDFFDPTEIENEAINPIHFEFRGITASATGFKSHFTYLEALDLVNGSPYEFAQQLAEELYQETKTNHPQIFYNQLNLF